MSGRPWQRRALFSALALAIVLSAVSGMGSNATREAPAAPVARASAPSAAPAPALARLELAPLQPRPAAPPEQAGGSAFAALTWHVPPPPPPPKPVAKAPPPPPPAPPPMPFSFLGRYEDGGTRIIMLVKADRIYTVSEGEVIEHTWRVGRLAGGQLELTYLPLGVKQVVSVEGT